MLLMTVLLSVQVQGSFFAREGDDPQFIKEQLLFNAFKNALYKRISELSLDLPLFKKNMAGQLKEKEAQFKEEYAHAKKEEDLTNSSTYALELRNYLLQEEKKLLNLDAVILSHSILRTWDSLHHPSLKNMEIEISLSDEALNDLYRQYTSTDNDYSTSYLVVQIEGADLELINNLKREMIPSLLNKVREKSGLNVQIADQYLRQRMFMDGLAMDRGMITFLDGMFSNARPLLFVLDLSLKENMQGKINDQINYIVKGDFLLLGKKQKVVFAKNFSLEELSKEKLLPSIFFEINPLLNDLKNIFPKITHLNNEYLLKVVNSQNILQLQELLNLLKSRLIAYSAELSISSYQSKESELLIRFEGERAKLLESIAGLNGESKGKFTIIPQAIGAEVQIYLRQETL